MASGQYSLAEVAKITGKSEKTISRWIKSGKLPAIRQGTGYLIDGDDIPLKLDASVDRQTYIQQRLISQDGRRDDKKNAGQRKVELSDLIDVAGLIANGQAERGSSSLDNINLMFQKHQAEVEKIIREQNELAEKYARATYKIGQLEERNRLLEDSNLKLEQKMTLLPPPEQWTFTQQELQDVRDNLEKTEQRYQNQLDIAQKKQDSYQQELLEMKAQLERERAENERISSERDALNSEHEDIKQQLESERQKGFWQRLFGS